jgi:HlyD family secretion protein
MRKWLLPMLALAAFGFAVMHVVRAQHRDPAPPPPVEPPRSPFGASVAGSGLIEPQTENIAMGSPVSGLVQSVMVKVGQKVKAGEVLFRLDDRHLIADLRVKKANLKAAQAKFSRLKAMPRKEELPPSAAKTREAEANFANERDLLERSRNLQASRAISEEEFVRRQQAYRMAEEQLAKARADFELLRAGAWEPDIHIAEAEIEQMKAAIEQTEMELDRLLVRASVDGEVLQVNVRPGEFVAATPGQALVMLGNVYRLHLRVDFDENDIFRYDPTLPAVASLRGNPKQQYQLTFVRIEPFVVPKKSLTGGTQERVDTRVLQAIYAIEAPGERMYVGQQLDVFVESKKR